MEMKF